MYADAEEFGGKIDDITGFPAGEAVIPLFQLQTGVVVIVEGTQGHPMLTNSKSEAFGSLSGRDCCLDGFLQIHFLNSLTYLFRKRIVPTIEEVFLPTIFMWKSEKNGLILRQPEIEKPYITKMFAAYGNSPVIRTDSLIEFQ